MDPVTHATTGLICSQLLPAPSRWWAAAAGIFFALLPDIDYFLVFWDRLAFIRHHRGFTHSLVALPLLALLGAGLGRWLGGPRWFRPLFFLGLAVLASHLLLDLATSYGTQIFNPISHRRFTLDWLFIIDPYLTVLLVAGAAGALLSPSWGRKVGAYCLAAAGTYMLLCGYYHHQAVTLAYRAFQPGYLGRGDCGLIRRLPRELPWQSFPDIDGRSIVAALPQPFSCRRWQLLGATPEGVKQAFVELPYGGEFDASFPPEEAAAGSPLPDRRNPDSPYQAPPNMKVQTWAPAPASPRDLPAEAGPILARFLEFARFPLLHRAQTLEGGQLWEWLDLRFSVPGRASPFVLRLYLDAQGHLQRWALGRERSDR